jgi:hypothetical protein
MAGKNRVNVSAGPPARRLSSRERHAAQVAAIANEQSDLKREAAERRAKRDAQSAAGAPKPD